MSNILYKLYFAGTDSVLHVKFYFIPFALSLNIHTLKENLLLRVKVW